MSDTKDRAGAVNQEHIKDPVNLWKGFGCGPLLVFALHHLLLGPKAVTLALGAYIASRKPKAHIYRIWTITSGCITYAAVLVHFALSLQDTFSATGFGNKFNYEKFYQHIISAIEEHMSTNQCSKLLAWWNGSPMSKKLFSVQYLDSLDDDNNNDNNDKNTVFTQMVTQAAAQNAMSLNNVNLGLQQNPVPMN
ncbi:hypothetical protein K466DRAFT_603734 [Polyporus arcularius HHB13444]|uniref:Uncharacterized protein n=1 Tax=Polyporus arcularius HHB13444 TaxID=1314778 RepID=A0A5C3NY58_9APHY|nr:hypothetical protein K466DRAFT_603734 [Polyporus arcularius HHB13444]